MYVEFNKYMYTENVIQIKIGKTGLLETDSGKVFTV